MSLVNDMLRDLEERWPNNPEHGKSADLSEGGEPPGQSQQPHYGIRPSRRSSKTPMLLAMMAVVTFALVVGIGYWILDKPEQHSSVAVVSPLVQSVQQPKAEQTSAVVSVDDSSAPAEAVTVAVVSEEVGGLVTAEIQLQIDKLLRAGNAALLIDRLTTPDYDNAYDRFRAVLSLNPTDAEGLQGLQRVQERYLEMLDKALSQGRNQSVPGLLRKARLVGVSQKTLDARIAAYTRVTNTNVLNTNVANTSAPEKNTALIVDQSATVSVPVSVPAPAPASPQSVPPKTSSVVNASSVFKDGSVFKDNMAVSPSSDSSPSAGILTQSLQTRDEKVVERAQRLQQAGLGDDAIAELRQFVTENPQVVAAYQELFSLYVQRSDFNGAEQILSQARHLAPSTRSYMAAQLSVARQDYPAAMAALNSQSPPIESAQAYYALQAAVYHKLGRLDLAEAGYRSLISVAPRNATYWLGLAVALDDAHKVDALPAFRKVKSLMVGGEAYMSYVDTRITALTGSR